MAAKVSPKARWFVFCMVAAAALLAVAALAPGTEAATTNSWRTFKGDAMRDGLAPAGNNIYLGLPQVLASNVTTAPVHVAPVVADIDGDGAGEIFVITGTAGNALAGATATVEAFKFTGSTLVPLWSAPIPFMGPTGTGTADPPTSFQGGLVVGDIGGSSAPEVLVSGNFHKEDTADTFDQGVVAVFDAASGAVIAPGFYTQFGANEAPVLIDLNSDGVSEAVIVHTVTSFGSPCTPPTCIGTPYQYYEPRMEGFKVDAAGAAVKIFDSGIMPYYYFYNERPAPSFAIDAVSKRAVVAMYNVPDATISVGAATTDAYVVSCSVAIGGASCGSNAYFSDAQFTAVTLGEMTGDGALDAVVTGSQGATTYAVLRADSMSVQYSSGGDLLENNAAIGDIDGDNKGEAVTVGYSSNAGDSHADADLVVRNPGTKAIMTRTAGGLGGAIDSPEGGVLVDLWKAPITGDKRPEFVFGAADNTLNFVKFIGVDDSDPGSSPTLLDTWTLTFAGVPTSPAVADLTRDCRPELVVGTDDGGISVIGDNSILFITSPPIDVTATTGELPGPPRSVYNDLSWSAPVSDGGSPVTAYKIFRGMTPGTGTLLATVPATALTYHDAAVITNTRYYYSVAAVNCIGTSLRSLEINVLTNDILDPQKVTGLGAYGITTSRIDLGWDAGVDNKGVTGYELFFDDEPGVDLTDVMITIGAPTPPPIAAPPTTYQHEGLVVDQTYYYRIRAFDGAGNRGPLSDLKTFFFTLPPGTAYTAGAKTLNNEPIAADSLASGFPGRPIPINLADLVVEPDGQDVLYTVLAGPQGGTLTGTAPDFVYNANDGYCGPDQFTFQVAEPTHMQLDPYFGKVKDTALKSKLATVQITNCISNGPPVANDQYVRTLMGVAVSFTLDGHDEEPGPEAMTFTLLSEPINGILTGVPPTMTYARNAGCGNDQFSWRLDDGLSSTLATVVIHVACSSNEAPEAFGQELTAVVGVPLPIHLLAKDPEGDVMTYAVATPPGLGILSGDGSSADIVFTPDHLGDTFFTFTAHDGLHASAPAIIAINVLGAPPVGASAPLDTDLDGNPDLGDNCPGLVNHDQINVDRDAEGNGCDTSAIDPVVIPTKKPTVVKAPDLDDDAVPDSLDNCLRTVNIDQADMDGDGQGDLCDNDTDGDGSQNSLDNCPAIPNPRQGDADGDNVGDVCDLALPVASGQAQQPAATTPEPTATKDDKHFAPVVGLGLLAVAVLLAAVLVLRRRRA